MSAAGASKRGRKAKATAKADGTGAPSEKLVISKLKEVIDPHTNISVYDMGLISELKVGKNSVSLVFRPTSPFCPLGMNLARSIHSSVMSVKGVQKADVKVIGHVYEDQINGALKASSKAPAS